MTRSCTVSSSSARGAASTPTSARGMSARIASAICSFSASTRSSGRVRLTATTTSTNSLSPTGARARRRPRPRRGRGRHAPHDFGRARRRGVGQRVDGAAAEPPAGDADEQRNHECCGRIRPLVAERHPAEAHQHRDRRPHVGAEVQRVGLQRLARGLAGHAIEQAGAEEIDHDRNDDHGEGRTRRLDRMGVVAEQPFAASQITTPDSRNSSAVSASAEMLSTLPWP